MADIVSKKKRSENMSAIKSKIPLRRYILEGCFSQKGTDIVRMTIVLLDIQIFIFQNTRSQFSWMDASGIGIKDVNMPIRRKATLTFGLINLKQM